MGLVFIVFQSLFAGLSLLAQQDQAEQIDGWRPNEIRAELLRKGLSYNVIALETGGSLPEISMCVSGERIYPHIRKAVARHLDRSESEIFGAYHAHSKTGRLRAA